MKLGQIIHLAWRTFSNNKDKNALLLEATTIFCLSLCVGIILGLNAIFNDLIERAQSVIELNSPILIPQINSAQDIYALHDGLSAQESLPSDLLNPAGAKLMPSKKNIVLDGNSHTVVVIPSEQEAICYAPTPLKKFTIYDVTSGFNMLGLPFKSATFECSWQKSKFSLVKVPQKYWGHVYGEKYFSYSIMLTDFEKPSETLHELNKLAMKHGYTVENADYQQLEYLRISFLQKRIFTTVFSLLCILLFSLMMMNCSIFIKQRVHDWELFYIFKVERFQTNLLIAVRFTMLFFTTVALSLVWAIIIANISTSVVQDYLFSRHNNLQLGYSFTLSDIGWTYSLLMGIFTLCGFISCKGLHRKKPLPCTPAPVVQGLKIKGLNISYCTISQGVLPILKNIQFELSPHRLAAIVGVSGSGKTTLLNTIFNPSYLGEHVEIDIANTGYLPQNPHLIEELTIEENIALFNHSSKEQVATLIELFGIEKIMGNYPMEISGGEKQRACIVRALLSAVKNLVLDEPTASLDQANKLKVINIIKQMIETGQLSWALVVTHDSAVVDCCHQVWQLHAGQLLRQR